MMYANPKPREVPMCRRRISSIPIMGYRGWWSMLVLPRQECRAADGDWYIPRRPPPLPYSTPAAVCFRPLIYAVRST